MVQMWWHSFVLSEVLSRTSVLVGRGVHFDGPSACLDVIIMPKLLVIHYGILLAVLL